MPPSIPSELRPRFRPLKSLGVGAQGRVILAEDRASQALVALKILHRIGSPEARLRLQREAELTGRIRHPNLVRLLGAGPLQNEGFLVVYEALDGVELGRWIEGQGRAARSSLLEFAPQLYGALGSIHQAGFLHRDIKPANLFVVEGERLVLLDLGLATSIEPRTRLTQTGALLGTPRYFSPEVLKTGKYSVAGDLWAAATVLFEVYHQQKPLPSPEVREWFPQLIRHEAGAPLHWEDEGHFRFFAKTLNPELAARPPSTQASLELFQDCMRHRVPGSGGQFSPCGPEAEWFAKPEKEPKEPVSQEPANLPAQIDFDVPAPEPREAHQFSPRTVGLALLAGGLLGLGVMVGLESESGPPPKVTATTPPDLAVPRLSQELRLLRSQATSLARLAPGWPLPALSPPERSYFQKPEVLETTRALAQFGLRLSQTESPSAATTIQDQVLPWIADLSQGLRDRSKERSPAALAELEAPPGPAPGLRWQGDCQAWIHLLWASLDPKNLGQADLQGFLERWTANPDASKQVSFAEVLLQALWVRLDSSKDCAGVAPFQEPFLARVRSLGGLVPARDEARMLLAGFALAQGLESSCPATASAPVPASMRARLFELLAREPELAQEASAAWIQVLTPKERELWEKSLARLPARNVGRD